MVKSNRTVHWNCLILIWCYFLNITVELNNEFIIMRILFIVFKLLFFLYIFLNYTINRPLCFFLTFHFVFIMSIIQNIICFDTFIILFTEFICTLKDFIANHHHEYSHFPKIIYWYYKLFIFKFPLRLNLLYIDLVLFICYIII